MPLRGWVSADGLRPGDVLLSESGAQVVGTRVRHFSVHAHHYNLTVHELHTFFVGASELLVHNCGGAQVVRIGQLGEAAIRAVVNVGPKAAKTINGTDRMFDGLLNDSVSEIKNVAYQAYTRQLKDSLAYAQQNFLRFDLYVRATTKLSGPLNDAVHQGVVNLFSVL